MEILQAKYSLKLGCQIMHGIFALATATANNHR